MPVIGFLSATSADASIEFLEGLKETGYVEGRNVAIEHRGAEGQFDRLPALAADLVRRRVAVIVTGGLPAALAAKEATTTIPIVFSTGVDPVASGLVASLKRPGGNLTGGTYLAAELMPKRLQMLRELIPNAGVFGISGTRPIRLSHPSPQTWRRRRVYWDCNSLSRMPEAISKRLSQLCCKSALLGSWSARVASFTGARNNSWH
jgi:hypothetical protein